MQPQLITNEDFSDAEMTSVWQAMMVQFHEHARAEICFAKQLPGISFLILFRFRVTEGAAGCVCSAGDSGLLHVLFIQILVSYSVHIRILVGYRMLQPVMEQMLLIQSAMVSLDPERVTRTRTIRSFILVSSSLLHHSAFDDAS